LSAREKQVLDLLVEGRPSKLIAYDLGISPPDCGASSLCRDEEDGGKITLTSRAQGSPSPAQCLMLHMSRQAARWPTVMWLIELALNTRRVAIASLPSSLHHGLLDSNQPIGPRVRVDDALGPSFIVSATQHRLASRVP